MKRLLFVLITAVLAACSGGDDTVATSVALTVAAVPTQTLAPTDMPRPTDTLVPSPTPIPTVELTCSEEAADFAVAASALLDEWDDTNELADSTARIALSGPVSDLQDIKQRASALDAPDCAAGVKDTLLGYMDIQTDVYLTFMAEDPVESLLAITQAYRAAVNLSLPALRDGAEFEEALATMLVLGSPVGTNLEIDSAGEYQNLPWLETRPVDAGAVSLTAFTNVSDDHYLSCYLFLNGVFVDSQFDEGPRISITCEGEVK